MTKVKLLTLNFGVFTKIFKQQLTFFYLLPLLRVEMIVEIGEIR